MQKVQIHEGLDLLSFPARRGWFNRHVPYFERLDETTYRPTDHVSGAWRREEQHIAPALGLLTHLVEADHAERRGDVLPVSRLSFDIYGTVPVEPCTAQVRVLRPGRTIELVEATLSHANAGRPSRAVVVLRAWLSQPTDTADLAGSDLTPMPAPDELEPWDPSSVWGGGFIASVQLRRQLDRPGRGRFWVRSDVPLMDEPVSATATAVGFFDIANGMTVREDPRKVLFPNLDLTAHLFRQPEPGWLGVDSTVSFGPQGHGLTNSALHDERGPIGVLAQSLTVRPLRG